MSTPIYRRAVDSEIPELITLMEQGQLDTRDLRAEDILVAEVEGRVVGINRIKHYPDGALEIASAYVIPEFREHGINRRLTEILRDECHGPVYIVTSTLNDAYVQRMGFLPVDDRSKLPHSIQGKVEWCTQKYTAHIPQVYVFRSVESPATDHRPLTSDH